MNKKNGFTLAEIMISVVTLGIIAALLIPAIVGTKPNNNKVMFKKAYSTLEKAVSELINDDRYYPSDMVCGSLASDPCSCNSTTSGNTARPAGSQCGFAYKDITGMNIPADANTTTKKFVYLLSQKLNTVGDVNYTTGSLTTKIFTTSDGIDWYCDFSDFNTSFPDFYADVNGEKGPNSAADNKNKDKFNFNIYYQGKILLDIQKEQDILKNPLKNHD